MLEFHEVIDYRARQCAKPQVARFIPKPGVILYVVVGTTYGKVHTIMGETRVWKSYSGARRYLREKYVPL